MNVIVDSEDILKSQNAYSELCGEVKSLNYQLAQWKQEAEVLRTQLMSCADERDQLKAQLEATKLKWQTGKVKETGYYWYRCIGWHPEHNEVKYLGNGESLMADERWAGPITEPEEKP